MLRPFFPELVMSTDLLSFEHPSVLLSCSLLQNCWHRIINITSFEKHLESSLDHTRTSFEIWWYFVPRICVKRNISSALLMWSSVQTKEGQRHTEFHLVCFENSQTPLATTTDPLIIERSLCLVVGPSTALDRPFLKHCTLTNTLRWGLYDGPCPNLLRGDKILIFDPSDC